MESQEEEERSVKAGLVRDGVLEKARHQLGCGGCATCKGRPRRGGSQGEGLAVAERPRCPRADPPPSQGSHWSGNPGIVAPAVGAVEDPQVGWF